MPCFLVPLITSGLSAAVFAQTSEPATDKAAPAAAAARPQGTDAPSRADRPGNALAALKRVLPEVNFAETPLEDALTRLTSEQRVNLIVRWRRLEAAGVRRDTPVTLSLRRISFGEAMTLLLDAVSADQELAYQVWPEKIVVSTLADFNAEMITQVYDVRDVTMRHEADASIDVLTEFTYIASLQPVVDENSAAVAPVINTLPVGVSLHTAPGGGPDFDLSEPFSFEDDDDDDDDERQPGDPGTIEDLINVIVNTVEPQSWVVNGGRGTIVPFDGRLVVRNSRYVHQLLAGPTLQANPGR